MPSSDKLRQYSAGMPSQSFRMPCNFITVKQAKDMILVIERHSLMTFAITASSSEHNILAPYHTRCISHQWIQSIPQKTVRSPSKPTSQSSLGFQYLSSSRIQFHRLGKTRALKSLRYLLKLPRKEHALPFRPCKLRTTRSLNHSQIHRATCFRLDVHFYH